MASELLPEPDTPATATTRQSGISTSRSRRLLCRTPRASMTSGSRVVRAPSVWPGVERTMPSCYAGDRGRHRPARASADRDHHADIAVRGLAAIAEEVEEPRKWHHHAVFRADTALD